MADAQTRHFQSGLACYVISFSISLAVLICDRQKPVNLWQAIWDIVWFW